MEPSSLPDRPAHLREWHRGYPERKIAGVCAGVADQLGLNVTIVRAGFVLLTLLPVSGLGLLAYLILWLMMPPRPGAASGLDELVELASRVLGVDREDRERTRERRRISEDFDLD